MKKQIIFHSQDPQFEAQEQESVEQPLEGELQNALKPRPSKWRKLFFSGVVLLIIALLLQGIDKVITAWQQHQWGILLLILACGLIVVAGLGSLLTEWWRLGKLRQRELERHTANELLHSHGLEQGVVFCQKLARQAHIDTSDPAYQRWQSALHESQHDKEVILLYSRLVQPVVDQRVRKEISRYAAESAVMVAVSPYSLVDMMFIAWRSFRLINRIAFLYGIELGYYSRIRLFRLVLINIAFAGVSEVFQDMGVDWLSQDLTAKLSLRSAQGLGVGLLTARLGIKAMELCRPLPWLNNDKPKLMEFRSELLNLIKEKLTRSQSIK